MKLIIGLLILSGCLAGGYIMAHGELLALWQPAELVIISGGAIGAFVISNPGKVIGKVLKNLPTLLQGSKYTKSLYMDLLGLMYDIFTKSRKEGLMALENDIEDPASSEVFNKYPRILADHHTVDFICDYLRLMVGGTMNTFELENLMDVELGTHHAEAELSSSALNRMADGLPGFGIVAAVMGVVITMGSLDGEVSEIGGHVAAALVGTFLGILLAYGVVGPMASALEHSAREETKFYECIKVCIIATLNGYNPQVAVEFGRKTLFSTERPSFIELENHVRGRT
ncbi:MAG: flagellar motor stator protein MotA [Gammaproteobacteria bacterium RBG_16_57_12]|nr:MAG: flagellar motor stator protein MotA [Gammaproteobacteria bacterium RBG_16_57_12]